MPAKKRACIREQASQSPAQQHNIISGLNRTRKGGLVRIEVAQHAGKQSLGCRGGSIERCLSVAVELEQFREQGQDEGKGELPASKSCQYAYKCQAPQDPRQNKMLCLPSLTAGKQR